MGFLYLPETASLSLKINVVRQRFFAFLAKRQFFPIGVTIVLSFSGSFIFPPKTSGCFTSKEWFLESKRNLRFSGSSSFRVPSRWRLIGSSCASPSLSLFLGVLTSHPSQKKRSPGCRGEKRGMEKWMVKKPSNLRVVFFHFWFWVIVTNSPHIHFELFKFSCSMLMCWWSLLQKVKEQNA